MYQMFGCVSKKIPIKMFKFPIKTWSNQLNPLKYVEIRKKHLKNVLLNPLLVTLWPLFFGPPASPPPEGRPSWNGTRRSPQSENDRKIPKNVMVLYLHVPISQKIDSRSSSYRSFAISSLFFPYKIGSFLPPQPPGKCRRWFPRWPRRGSIPRPRRSRSPSARRRCCPRDGVRKYWRYLCNVF